MCEYLDGLVEAKFDEEVKGKPALKNQLSKNPPYATVYDRETGDATGEIEFKFKLKAKVNTRDGRTFVQVLNLVEYGSPATSVFDEEDGFVAEASAPSNTVAEVFTDGDF